jgi:hypothetical protein
MDARKVDMGDQAKRREKVSQLSVLVLLSLVVFACQPIAKSGLPTVPPVKAEQPRYLITTVGQVTSFEKESGIVLVRQYGSIPIKSGDVFLTGGVSGTNGNIMFTGQQNNLFKAAELQSGSLSVGDLVYRRRLNPKFDPSKLEGIPDDKQDAIVLPEQVKDEPFSAIEGVQ